MWLVFERSTFLHHNHGSSSAIVSYKFMMKSILSPSSLPYYLLRVSSAARHRLYYGSQACSPRHNPAGQLPPFAWNGNPPNIESPLSPTFPKMLKGSGFSTSSMNSLASSTLMVKYGPGSARLLAVNLLLELLQTFHFAAS